MIDGRLCRSCMKDAGVSANEIKEVLLVGGMTRMPKVRLRVRRLRRVGDCGRLQATA